MPFIKCPVFVIHGKRDWIVPLSHAEKLVQLANDVDYIFHDDMTHNRFLVFVDIVCPVNDYMRKIGSERKLIKHDLYAFLRGEPLDTECKGLEMGYIDML